MAKKSRRVRKGARPRLSEAQLVQPKETAIQAAPPVAVVEETASERIDFSQEYHYVVQDLQRIGILAVTILGGLVVLSFIL